MICLLRGGGGRGVQKCYATSIVCLSSIVLRDSPHQYCASRLGRQHLLVIMFSALFSNTVFMRLNG